MKGVLWKEVSSFPWSCVCVLFLVNTYPFAPQIMPSSPVIHLLDSPTPTPQEIPTLETYSMPGFLFISPTHTVWQLGRDLSLSETAFPLPPDGLLTLLTSLGCGFLRFLLVSGGSFYGFPGTVLWVIT